MSVTASTFRQWLHIHCSQVLRSGVRLNPLTRSPPFKHLLGVSFFCRSMGDRPALKESKEELKQRLTPIQFHVTQEKGTERAFTGKWNKCKDIGVYSCVVCNEDLFSSATKFESGCGWPSFNDVIDQGKVKLSKDASHVGANLLLLIANPGMVRTEVTCSFCGAHLGHVFNDGPKPTKRRFCINSASLNFRPATEEETKQTNGS